MNPAHYTSHSNNICALAPTMEYNFLAPATGILTVVSGGGKLKVAITVNGGSTLYVAFCPSNGAISGIPINAGHNVKIINYDHNCFDVYTSVIAERPQIQMQWDT